MDETTYGQGAAMKKMPRTSGSGDYASGVNVGDVERLASAIGGGALALLGLTRALSRGSLLGWALTAVGGSLLYRGISGHCSMYGALGINRATGHRTVTGNLGVKIDKSVTVNAAPEQVYRYWRNLENLPRIMSHLERVQVTGGNRSRWAVKAPAGMTVECDAEIIADRPHELIAWRSLEGSDVDHAGSVHFKPAPAGRGTEVRVEMQYIPPGGIIGAAIAKLFGEAPDQQLQEDLRRFKQTMEVGEVIQSEATARGRGPAQPPAKPVRS